MNNINLETLIFIMVRINIYEYNGLLTCSLLVVGGLLIKRY